MVKVRYWLQRIKAVRGTTILLALIGLVLLLVHGWWMVSWPPPIGHLSIWDSLVEGFRVALEGLAVALLVAAALVETVDLSLKKELLRDAIQAAYKYVLHEGLKAELGAILGHRIVCVDHEQVCRLERKGDAVVVHMTLRRTYENVGHDEQKLEAILAIDEWCSVHGRSRIVMMSYLKDRESKDLEVDEPEKSEDGVLKVKYPELTLEPGEKVTTWSEFEEVKQLNDAYHLFCAYPTINPRVTLRKEDDSGEMDGTVGFAHRGESYKGCGGEYFELRGTLLVSQPITVRWWNKAQLEAAINPAKSAANNSAANKITLSSREQ